MDPSLDFKTVYNNATDANSNNSFWNFDVSFYCVCFKSFNIIRTLLCYGQSQVINVSMKSLKNDCLSFACYLCYLSYVCTSIWIFCNSKENDETVTTIANSFSKTISKESPYNILKITKMVFLFELRQ